ncbi:DUF2871 domain-containing protein [Arthrobacter sp. SDTb3-6]|uniref:DUF2871 domain-containing protein n=1 Tax=Arthrobacter sp. SDTb3-6 TaxID=2713571 RepID=UPI00159E8D2F|nr:DUF2871 domain-containing protein [Arthrobacter sp. SDTb3-6]NVM97398.1 DUF2871 domain-containing protein [Arthrobacter sp. SDTb3-6]
MKKLFYASFADLVPGMLSGLFYREFSMGKDVTGFTQLSVVHTHLPTLGFIVLLAVLILEKLFTPSGSHLFSWFFATYNAGPVLTCAMPLVHGMLQVDGAATVSAAIAGTACLGHILPTAMVLLFPALRSRLSGATVKHDAGTPAALAG